MLSLYQLVKDLDMGMGVAELRKTCEQHKHARGTLSDLPRNTQAQKQRRISPFIAGGEKIDNKVHYK